MTAVQFTTRPYQRSHSKAPSGRGSWAFQCSTTEVAFARDLLGEVMFFQGTLTEAKAQARAFVQQVTGGTGSCLLAVLP